MRDWSYATSPRTEEMILARLQYGDALTGSDFWRDASPLKIDPHLWESLLRLEKKGLIWRAFDHEDWRTMHRWKITGCGLLETYY